MSEMEYNKGKLIPTGIDTEHFTDEDYENCCENGLVLIDGEFYSVEFDIERGELYGFQKAFVNEDSSISFETYHYNGGGHWTECVQSALKGDSQYVS